MEEEMVLLRKIIDTEHEPVLVLDLPKKLQGRRIEVIAFAIDEIEVTESKPGVMGDFYGTLSAENAEKLHAYVNKARWEWERGI